jgi:hypothetical protein
MRRISAGAVVVSSIFGALALALAGCGGGGNESGPSDQVVVSPAEVTVSGQIGVCGAGLGPTVHVFGGLPPYKLTNSVPTYLQLDKTEVGGSGEGFTMTFLGGCLDKMPINVEDRAGRVVSVLVTNQKGS